MTQHPEHHQNDAQDPQQHDEQPGNQLPKETSFTRWLPIFGPAAIVLVALLIMLVMWLPQ
ncbi:hypothetical protein GCM10009584_23540 [Ornithinimicrobium humiphilum]|uniref:Uncharacterized protein n=1 Tax=Ornithinimicrobium humiphilum TaxID=125288 RepID=A0A543KMP8_9MICO|nr:hypothetical protein [Ornithinimicrobium humiphilum]TQM96353.1 hypothetical protein FB476_1219 [Ornithinimicrobium humiphilum]